VSCGKVGKKRNGAALLSMFAGNAICCDDAREIPSTCCRSFVYKCLTSAFRPSASLATSHTSQASKSGCWIRFVIGVSVHYSSAQIYYTVFFVWKYVGQRRHKCVLYCLLFVFLRPVKQLFIFNIMTVREEKTTICSGMAGLKDR